MPEDFLYYWDGTYAFKKDYIYNSPCSDNEKEAKDAFACYCMMSI